MQIAQDNRCFEGFRQNSWVRCGIVWVEVEFVEYLIKIEALGATLVKHVVIREQNKKTKKTKKQKKKTRVKGTFFTHRQGPRGPRLG